MCDVVATGRAFRLHHETLKNSRRPGKWRKTPQRWRKRRQKPEIKSQPLLPNLDWSPPENFNYHRLFGPRIAPKIGKPFSVKFSVAIANVIIGGFYTPDCKGDLPITLRILNSTPVPNSRRPYYSVVAKIAAMPSPEIDLCCSKFCVTLRTGMFMRFIYCPDLGQGAVESFFDKSAPAVTQYVVPNYHFINCITCVNHDYQISYEVNAGPTFNRLLHIPEQPEKDSPIPNQFRYSLTKSAYAKHGDSQIITARFSADIKITKICHYEASPDHCMAIGQILRAFLPVIKQQKFSAYEAENPAESDENLFVPGTYVHIDHWRKPDLDKAFANPNGPYESGIERAYINYFVGPKTATIGCFPYFQRET